MHRAGCRQGAFKKVSEQGRGRYYPWWDEKHPATRQHLKRQKKPKRKNGRKNDDADDIPW